MPAGTTRDHDDSVSTHQLLSILLDATHSDRTGFRIQSSPHAIIYRLGLLEDLLEHKMIVATFFDRRQLYIQFLNVWSDLFIAQVFETADTLVAIENAKAKGAIILGVVNS